jgi:hypothetical protein
MAKVGMTIDQPFSIVVDLPLLSVTSQVSVQTLVTDVEAGYIRSASEIEGFSGSF